MTDDLKAALELPLLFHGGGDWDDAKRTRWYEVTGTYDASTKVMCDHIRSVLARAYSGAPCPVCGGGFISTAHGKCSSCNHNHLGSLPANSAYDALRKIVPND